VSTLISVRLEGPNLERSGTTYFVAEVIATELNAYTYLLGKGLSIEAAEACLREAEADGLDYVLVPTQPFAAMVGYLGGELFSWKPDLKHLFKTREGAVRHAVRLLARKQTAVIFELRRPACTH
jgi:hypothetical protein